MRTGWVSVVTLLIWATCTSASAQDGNGGEEPSAPVAAAPASRIDQVQQQRAEKLEAVSSYQPGKLETFLLRVEEDFVLQRLFNPPRGMFLRFGGMPEGGGIGAGPAYRYSNHAVSFTTSAAVTVLRYWEIDTRLAFPAIAGGRMFAEVGGRHRDLPQEDFYGLGANAPQFTQSSYAYRETSGDALGGFRLTPWLSLAGSVQYVRPDVGNGKQPGLPDIDQIFSDRTAPGLDAQPDFARVGARALVDYTDRPLGPRSGGRYLVSYDQYTDRDLNAYSFDRWDVDVRQYVPLVNRERTIALRARLASLSPESGQEVPFYLQPTLGGGTSLRGFKTQRLRDRNLLLLQAEYRWDVNPFITGAVFYDAGQVAFRRSDLNLDDLNHDYGIGVRFGWMKSVSLRTEVAFGSKEGRRLVFKFDDVF